MVGARPIVPFVPSPMEVVMEALELAGVGPGDRVVDLGCGDGRVVVAAAKFFGAEGVCVEIDKILCGVAEVFAKVKGVGDRVRILCRDFSSIDLGEVEPTVLYLYLYPSVLEELGPKIEKEVGPGVRVVSLEFPIRGWSPIGVRGVVDEHGYEHTIWLYVTGLSNPAARTVGIMKNVDRIVQMLRRVKIGRGFGILDQLTEVEEAGGKYKG